EERAAAAAQGPGEEIRLVAEVGSRREDPLAGLVADRDAGVPAVQDPGDRGDRDPRALRHVAEGDRPARLRHAAPPRLLTPRTIVPVRRKRQGLSLSLRTGAPASGPEEP